MYSACGTVSAVALALESTALHYDCSPYAHLRCIMAAYAWCHVADRLQVPAW